MTWNSSLPDRTAPMKRSQMKRHGKRPRGRVVKQHDAEWLRAHESVERVLWVKAQPCIIADQHQCEGPIENAHVVTGGTGRKADARFIVPACRKAHRGKDGMHDGVESFALRYGLDLDALAAATEAAWRKISG